VVVELHFRQCFHCQRELSFDQFYRKGSGFHADCKACISMKRKAQYIPRKKADYDEIKNIIIEPLTSEMAFSKKDIIACLQSFLLEELRYDQRIGQ
jgi:hypothetical protein